MLRWLKSHLGRAVLGVADDYDDRLDRLESLYDKLNVSVKSSRLRSLRNPPELPEDVVAQAQAIVAQGQETQPSEPAYIRVRRTARR